MGDIFEGLVHVLDKQGKLDADKLVKMFDKNKDILISHNEIAQMVKKILNCDMTPPEIKMLHDHMIKKHKRSDLKRAELMDLLTEERVSNEFNDF